MLQITVWLTIATVSQACLKAMDSASIHARARKSTFELLVNGRLEGTGFFLSPDGYAMTVLHALKKMGK